MDRDNSPTATQANSGGNIGRRAFVAGVGVSATGAGLLSLDSGPVQESEALLPLIGAGVVGVGASVSLGWALRDFEILGQNPPAEGLTADALRQKIKETTRTRKSTNASTIVDNQNILDGVENTAYTEGKIAAIEALNAGKTESEVLNDATTTINSYETTVKKNLFKSWNESVAELEGIVSTLDAHPNLANDQSVLKVNVVNSAGGFQLAFQNRSVTFPDGSNFDLKSLQRGGGGSSWDPKSVADPDSTYRIDFISDDGSTEFGYLADDTWNQIFSEMDTKFQNVRTGMGTWVTNVYGQVQSGEIEVSELLTPRERAAIKTDSGKYPQAVADLIALNVPVDLEREATVSISSTGTTLKGTFGLTDESDGPLESGTTYDPSTFSGDAYLTTDISRLKGTWSAFETGVNGGVITLTEEPYASMVYSVSTAAGETVDVSAADWSDNGDGTYSYDASGDLETAITNVSEISYSAETTKTTYETIQLDSQFTIEKFENTETGEEVSQTSFTSSEPQTDSNYITQDEWNSLEQQNKDLIEKYEESQNTPGGGGGFLDGTSDRNLGLLAGGAVVVLYLLGNNN